MPKAGRTHMTALIVEDDRCQSELGAAMLQEFDMEVEQVQSAQEAIDHLRDRSGQVGVLLTDVNLPGDMDGIALAHRVAILWPGISLILTSGDPSYGPSGLPSRAIYVPKPWRALDIVAVAERAARADHSVHAVEL